MDVRGERPNRRPGFRRRLAVLFACTWGVMALAACGADEAPDALAGVVREPALEVAEVELPHGVDGTTQAMRAADGGLLVVYFGYTSCPDICPTTMSDLSVAVNDLPPEQAERVQVAFVTVDPDRDRGEDLQEYLDHFFTGGLPLRTEDPEELSAAAEAFGVQFEVADHTAGQETYDVAHTAVTYVVDDEGRVVVEWPFGFESELMTSDMQTLFNKETT